jgi:hypothetical protein
MQVQGFAMTRGRTGIGWAALALAVAGVGACGAAGRGASPAPAACQPRGPSGSAAAAPPARHAAPVPELPREPAAPEARPGAAAAGTRAAPPLVGGKQVRSAMWRMAVLLGELDVVMDTDVQHIDRRQVVDLLRRVEEVAAELGKDPAAMRHPLFRDNVAAVIAQAGRACQAAESLRPNYYWAGALGGTCIQCHGPEPVPAAGPPAGW